MTTKTGTLHFRFGKGGAKLLMELTRQAYWMENRQDWALDTLSCLQGISLEQVKSILAGTAILDDCEDGFSMAMVEVRDEEWIEELKKYQEWKESRTYKFGNRHVSKELVDFYTNNIVSRLRSSMRMLNVVYDNPVVLAELEEQRRDTHNQILKEAGFDKIETIRRDYDDLEYAEFDRDFQKHLNKATNWLFPDYEDVKDELGGKL